MDVKKKVADALHQIAETFKPQLYQDELNRRNRIVREIEKHDGITSDVEFASEHYKYVVQIDSHFTHGTLRDRDGNFLRLYKITDLHGILKYSNSCAEAHAKMVCEDFEWKIEGKLAAILETSFDKVSSVTVGGDFGRNTVNFVFTDGSRFRTLAQIVSVWRSGRYGRSTNFRRYPLTFHDVVIRGEHMKTPSEAKLKEAFLGIKTEPKGPVVHKADSWMTSRAGKKVGECVGSMMGAQAFYGTTTEEWSEVTCKKCLKKMPMSLRKPMSPLKGGTT